METGANGASGGTSVIRSLTTALVLVLLATASSPAQEWAKKLFKSPTTHDFGTVARGSKTIYEFEMENIFEEDVHIASVRASCGCTIPSIKKDTLKTWEKGAIIAEFNTRAFLGQRGATVTVTIDKPYYAEVQLNVKGYIRSDVVFNPGTVNFGEVDNGNPAEKRVELTYAGRDSWKILDVRSANPNLEVELTEKARGGGRVSYQMLVRLKDDAAEGYLEDQLTIVTDDARLKNIALPVEGRIVSPLTVSPGSLFLGVLEPGQKVTKQLVVKGKVPFRVTSVKCSDNCFEFKTNTESKTLHLIPVTFTASENPGKLVQTIQIETDMDKGGVAQCTATATIKDAAIVSKPGESTTSLKN
jgi:hypothetical protein